LQIFPDAARSGGLSPIGRIRDDRSVVDKRSGAAVGAVLRATFTTAFKRYWQKSATFPGRASRSEYWWWALVSGIFFLFALIPAVDWIFLLLLTLMPSNPACAHFDQSAASGMTTP